MARPGEGLARDQGHPSCQMTNTLCSSTLTHSCIKNKPIYLVAFSIQIKTRTDQLLRTYTIVGGCAVYLAITIIYTIVGAGATF
jgi:hypothetical protein